MNSKKSRLNKLLKTVNQLRSPKGCPWDRKQTADSLVKYLREEVEELVTAITNGDSANICAETADILYLLIMITEIHQEKDLFSFADVVSGINNKLIRRHPHVFQGKKVGNDSELRIQWETIKQQEKIKK